MNSILALTKDGTDGIHSFMILESDYMQHILLSHSNGSPVIPVEPVPGQIITSWLPLMHQNTTVSLIIYISCTMHSLQPVTIRKYVIYPVLTH